MQVLNSFESVLKYEIVDRNEMTPEEYSQAERQFPKTLKFWAVGCRKGREVAAIFFARTLPYQNISSQYLGLAAVNRSSEDLGYFHLEVLPQWRHQGIGTRLSLTTLQRAAALGFESICSIHQDNQEKDFLTKLPIPKLNSYSHETRFDLVDFKRVESQKPPYSFRSFVYTPVQDEGRLFEECNEAAKGFHYQIWEGEQERGTLLGTAHRVKDDNLKFNKAIRQSIEKCNILFLEHFLHPTLDQYITTDGQIFGKMDHHLLKHAERMNKAVGSLETVADLQLYNVLGYAQASKFNQEYVLQISQLGDIWAEGDLDKLLEPTNQFEPAFINLETLLKYREDFLKKRNVIHAHGIIKALEDKTVNVFAAIGSLHLPDLHFPPDPLPIKGVITLLQEHGFRVTSIG